MKTKPFLPLFLALLAAAIILVGYISVGRASSLGTTPCVGGMAGGYPCDGIDLLSVLTMDDFEDGVHASDSWGWTDPQTGVDYGLVGLFEGIGFVDLSNPQNPQLLGILPTHTTTSSFTDVKVFQNYAFIVRDIAGVHGMQVFDLADLRDVVSPPVEFVETAHYAGFTSAHNLSINEATGYAFVTGANTCGGGLTLVDVRNPLNPKNAGCYNEDGYTHDTQCVTYHGPDVGYQGREVCFNANVDTISIVDVTDKGSPSRLSFAGWPGAVSASQGWVTEDHSYFISGDEYDEINSGGHTRTFIWDISDLETPFLIGIHDGSDGTGFNSDNKNYIRGGYLFQANYARGIQVFDLSDIANGNLIEVASFDTHPGDDDPDVIGAWNVFPFFESGIILVSTIEGGSTPADRDAMFVLQLEAGLPDLTLEKTGVQDVVAPGGWLTYTLHVENVGLGSGTNIELTDTLPAVVTFQTASPGCTENSGEVVCDLEDVRALGEATVNIGVTVNPGATGVIENNAAVLASEGDANLGDNSDLVQTIIAIAQSFLPIMNR